MTFIIIDFIWWFYLKKSGFSNEEIIIGSNFLSVSVLALTNKHVRAMPQHTLGWFKPFSYVQGFSRVVWTRGENEDPNVVISNIRIHKMHIMIFDIGICIRVMQWLYASVVTPPNLALTSLLGLLAITLIQLTSS